MTAKQQRKAARTAPPALEVVTVYRDRKNIPYDEAVKRLHELSDLYAVFSVVAVVRDYSAEGLGISIEGQQLMSKNMLRPGEHYLLKLVLARGRFPRAISRFLVSEGNYSFLLVSAACRWHNQSDKLSSAGFEILDSNAVEVREFIRARFETARAVE